MLSKRDKLIIRIATQLGMYEEAWTETLLSAKETSGKTPLDRVMRDLNLITQKEHRQLARAFNDYIKQRRDDKAKAPSAPAAPERTVVLGSQDQVSAPDGTYVLPENQAAAGADATYVMPESGRAAPRPTADADSTYVLQDKPKAASQPGAELDGTYVLRDEAPPRAKPKAPPEVEMTYVLKDEDKLDDGPPLDLDGTYVLQDEAAGRPASRPTPPLDLDGTYVLKDEGAASPQPRRRAPQPPIDIEGTYVLKDEDAISSRQAPQPPLDLDGTYVLKDDAAPSRPQRRAPQPPMDIEGTYVLKDEDAVAPQRPATGGAPTRGAPLELDSTFVLKDEDPGPARPKAPGRRIEAQPMASFDDDDDLPKLTIPDDDELELESTVVLGGAPKPALPLDLDGTYVLKDEDAAPAPPRRRAPQPPMDIDGTYVLKDEDAVPARGSAPRRPAPQPPLELDGTYVLKDESASPKPFPAPPAELDSTYVLKDEAPARKPGAPAGFDSTYVLKDQDSDLELAVPEDLDSTYVLNEAPAKVTPKAPGRRVQAKTESELEIPELTLKSEAASTRRANALASGDGSAPAGGKLTRDVFQMLAKKRLPFKGYKIADYEIVEEISRGAMGVVLLAQPTGMAKTMAQARGFEGAVALKVMLENGADPKETERFVAEMKVLTKLNHPNIVRIFDCGAENGLTFFSMELLKGQDVRDLVRENGPPPIMLTLRIAAQIANALAYIHKSTVYHRDMKPTNIIFDKSVNPFRAVLIDFGLVTNHGDASDKGLILGTPQYMPPEQAAPRGGFGEVNATSDIYSLGATLYFMLTGRPPFIGSDPRKIIKRVATERVKDPAEINKEIPRRVADICLKCLEKQQRDRYPAARILSAELEKELKASQRMLKAKSFISRFWNPKG